jgi:surface protein
MFQKNRFFFVLLFAVQSLFAQIPQGFNYQATVRNQTGELLTNEYVGIRFHIVQGTEQNNPVYSELHYESTDDLGSLHLMIGQGAVEAGVFNQIDWSLGNYHMGIEINTGSGFIDMGTTQLMSVPFALYALNSGTTNNASLPQGTNDGDVLRWNSATNSWTVEDNAAPPACIPSPTLTTNEISNITDTSVTFSGTIEAPTCDPSVTSQGFVYGLNTLPKTTDRVIEVNGKTLSKEITGLQQNRTYYCRTYFTNPTGTYYGNELMFQTNIGPVLLYSEGVTNIKAFSTDVYSDIYTNGGAQITARGVCWSTNPNPTIADSKTEEGSGLGGFSSSLTGLTKDTTYNVRSYATNEAGTTYGEQVAFTTQDGIVSFATTSISNIRMSSATIAINITDDGGAAITARGVCWSTNPNPTIADSKTEVGSGRGGFSSSLTGLTKDTTYNVRSYATNEAGTTYGEQVAFTTQDGIVTFTTTSISNIRMSSATIAGNITDDGGAAITARGFCWSTNPNPTIADSKTEEGSGLGGFSSSLTGLTEDTTYNVRSYATNEVGTTYGEEISFKTYENLVYLDENSFTVRAKDDAKIGSMGMVNGVEYTVVDLNTLRNMIEYGEDVTTVCTSRITDMSNLSSMNSMFLGSSFNADISTWDVSNVTNMSSMFLGSSFNADISTWDVSNVTNMSSMFLGSSFNADISTWDVSNVTTMKSMFMASYFNQDLSAWDVSNVTDMSLMFSEENSFNQDLSAWDVSNVTNMSSMFWSSSFNQDLSTWDVSNVTSMVGMFSDASSFNQDLSSWDVSNVTTMKSMFSSAVNFNQDLSSWDVSNVTTMKSMFSSAVNFNQDLSTWDVRNVKDMGALFSNASSFNQDLSAWDVSNVTNMSSMFSYASSFNQDLSAWDVSNVTTMSSMFLYASSFNQDISTWDVSNVTNCWSFSDNNSWTQTRPNFTNNCNQ